MAVSLLRLSDGGRSLEFAPDELGAVFAVIRELFGEPSVKKGLDMASVGFGGAAFIYQDTWDDPCLISTDRRGVEILEQLAARVAS
jgi:hypothetical protein